MTTTTTYPACADHSEHDVNCNPCYLRLEHAENQTRPNATGHVVYPIKNCPDCTESEERKAELRQGESPGEQLERIARAAFTLDKALSADGSLNTERGLWRLMEAQEALQAELRQAGYYGKQYV